MYGRGKGRGPHTHVGNDIAKGGAFVLISLDAAASAPKKLTKAKPLSLSEIANPSSENVGESCFFFFCFSR